MKTSGSPLTLSKLTARSPATFYGAGRVNKPALAAVPSPSKAVKAVVSSSTSLLKKVLVANATAATPKMTPRGQIRVLAARKTPRSALKKEEGARRPLWSEVVAKKKDVTMQPTKVYLISVVRFILFSDPAL